jgi:hypothetical protein
MTAARYPPLQLATPRRRRQRERRPVRTSRILHFGVRAHGSPPRERIHADRIREIIGGA